MTACNTPCVVVHLRLYLAHIKTWKEPDDFYQFCPDLKFKISLSCLRDILTTMCCSELVHHIQMPWAWLYDWARVYFWKNLCIVLCWFTKVDGAGLCEWWKCSSHRRRLSGTHTQEKQSSSFLSTRVSDTSQLVCSTWLFMRVSVFRQMFPFAELCKTQLIINTVFVCL